VKQITLGGEFVEVVDGDGAVGMILIHRQRLGQSRLRYGAGKDYGRIQTLPPAGCQKVQEGEHVCFQIGFRVAICRIDAGLRGQMINDVHVIENSFPGVTAPDVHLQVTDFRTPAGQGGKGSARFVDPQDAAGRICQSSRKVGGDIASRAGDHNAFIYKGFPNHFISGPLDQS